MANSAYASGFNLDAMMVPVRAATVYAAQETSLYLPGQIVPIVQVPAGSATAQVPLMGSVSATVISSEDVGGSGNPQDFDTVLPSDTKRTITLNLHAARTVLRDLGGIDTADMGRILGNAIATSFDKAVTTEFKNLTTQEITAGNLDTDEIFAAVATIRGNGEGGQLYGIVSTDAYANLMSAIGSNAFAGGEFQNTAMRQGFFGNIAGVQMYVSSYLNNTDMGVSNNPKCAIFSADAVKAAMQGGVNIEVARRPEAVGFDIVASAAAGAEAIDGNRGVLIIDAA